MSERAHPVVFVHGAWHGAWCWEEHFLDYFARRGYDVRAPDLRAHGALAPTGALRGCRIRDYVADLAAATAACAQPPILIGHSMGGLVVQKYLERGQARAAILLAPVPVRGALGATLRTIRRIPRQFVKANLQLRLYPLIETEELAREAFFSADLDPALVRKYFQRLQDESYLAFLDMVAFSLPRPGRVQAPVLVLGGEHDAVFRPAEMRATAAAYGGDAVIFPGMAHDMMLERGWQHVADHCLGWLAAQGL
ncbi:MAG TPA: alpha/beta fold hydrolase [Chloroflexaceae bacterium]|nr:alpha/beta fold hydrolase [Chloroflexaceae bacterium]